MGVAEEIETVRNTCTDKVRDSKLSTCTENLVRVEISKSKIKTLLVILQFPESYPEEALLIELRSKTLDDKFTNGLTKVAEEHVKKYLGQPQVLLVLKFISSFLDEHPLCCCATEISAVKKLITNNDTIKLKQKTGVVSLKIQQDTYYFNINTAVPNNYPDGAVEFDEPESNFPKAFCKIFMGHAKEIARRCIEPPLLKKKLPANQPPFTPKPSLLPSLEFIIKHVHSYPTEKCPCCNLRCFPENPQDIIQEENHKNFVERILCGHLYHKHCLQVYMKTPPFQGGKKCLVCKQLISHEKYKITPQLAEARWAHQQARQREIDEVSDFFA